MSDVDAGKLGKAGIGIGFSVATANGIEQLDARLGPEGANSLKIATTFAFIELTEHVGIVAGDPSDAAANLRTDRPTRARPVTFVARPLARRATGSSFDAGGVVADPRLGSWIAAEIADLTGSGSRKQQIASAAGDR